MTELVLKKGTKKEVDNYLEFFLKYLKSEHDFSELSDKDFNRIFCEALGRNVVVSELVDMMTYIIEEGFQ